MKSNMSMIPVRLKMPHPRKNYIIRQRLFQQLRKYEEYKVTVVKAGAGCGKTTLLSSFVLEMGISNVCWITLDDNTNQAFIFWNYVLEALKEYIEDTKADFQNLFDSNIQKENLWKILELLLSKLNKEQSIVLVLDDFQMITDDFLISTIDYFIEHMPDNLHIVLLTREMPGIYLGGLAIEDQLLVIEEDIVRFSIEESREFLLDTLKLQKDEEQICSMIQVSEGWIGGLQLLAMSAKESKGQMVESLKVSSRVLSDYITKEIFSFLSVAEQEFLIETSILSYFSQNICEQFHLGIDFTYIMESILQKNLLIINVDEHAGIYRYHAILAEYLKGLFDKWPLDKREHLHSQAATIYEELEDYEESLYHLFSIHAYERIMKLILRMPQTATTFTYLMKVPMKEIVKNADFAYQYFFYYYASTDEATSKRIYQFIKQNMKDEMTFEAFRFSNLFFSDALNFQKANWLSLEQIKSLPLNDITTAFLLIKEAYFLYANSKLKEAIDYLNYAGDVYRRTGNIYIGIFVLSEKAQIYEDMGEFLLCLELYREMEPMICQVKSLASAYYIGIAGVYIRQLSLDLALEMLNKAKECISEDSENIERAYEYTLAEYCYLIGEADITEKMLIDIMGQEAYENVAYSARLLRYPLYRGQHKELAERFLTLYKESNQLGENMDGQLLYASIQYEIGNLEGALELVDALTAKSRKMQNKLKIVESALLKARILQENQGSRRDIQNLFVEAVSYATENRIAHPFWFERNTVDKIVSEMKTELSKELSKEEFEFLTSVLSADSKHGILFNANTREIKREEILTEREREVLQELAAGKTNLQIAEKLCVSLATVKTHINNIYGKFGVNNRVAAINKMKAD